ncbi:MAG: response regulator, partial [Lachnospiraceae bacterium]|nr:response regulator [Lachnospiraceae bacterium]
MNAICVDDEVQVLKHTVASCQQIRLLDDVRGFTRPKEALEWTAANPVDLALLDIHMPDMSGLELAEKLRNIQPSISIIFITAFSQYALEAYEVHPTSYLLKPFDQARLAREVEYALAAKASERPSHISVHTFGHFEILVDGKTLAFRRSKSKELLAYLVDRQGAGVTRQDAFAALWEDRPYDVSMQKQMDVVIRSLRETLQKYDIGDLFELKNRNMRILPELIDCDLYHFMEGDTETINAYFGEYMSQYTWG